MLLLISMLKHDFWEVTFIRTEFACVKDMLEKIIHSLKRYTQVLFEAVEELVDTDRLLRKWEGKSI